MKKFLLLLPLLFFTATAVSAQTLDAPLVKKVMVVNFNPVLEIQGGLRLTQYRGWEDPAISEQRYVSDIQSASSGVISYQIVERYDVDAIPVKQDGFQYTDSTILNCYNNSANCHMPDSANLIKIIQDYQACEKRNAGQIDELWIWGGPYFGFPESFSTGPNAFYINGPVISGTTCTKILPIMGFSYERSYEMLHNLGHRTEGTMTHVYGSWQENRTAHNWDKFGLVKAQSPNFSYSGCGSIHWTPNSQSEYQYGNTGNPTNTTCDNFNSYPNLSSTTRSVTCTEWQCSAHEYYRWWFRHLPKNQGIGPDGKLNNWWIYIVDYELAKIREGNPLPVATPLPSGCIVSTPQVSLVTPLNHHTYSTTTTTVPLSASAVFNTCTGYRYREIWTRDATLNQTFSQLCYYAGDTSNTTFSCSVSGLVAAHRYEWYATAYNERYNTQSNTRSFSIGVVPIPTPSPVLFPSPSPSPAASVNPADQCSAHTTVAACDGSTNDCAWYFCANNGAGGCFTTGTPNSVACPVTSPSPTPSPSYTVTDLRNSITSYKGAQVSSVRPADGKMNMLDTAYVIKWIQ